MPLRRSCGKATANKSMRLTWEDGSSVELYFTAKGDEKSQVAIQHRKLANKSDVAQAKAFWGERLSALVDVLVPSKAARR